MNRLTRFAVAALLLNLSLFGREVACEHEAQPAAATATSHDHGHPSDPPPPRPDDPSDQCDQFAAICCTAIASCSVSGVVETLTSEASQQFASQAVLRARNIEPSSAAPEVATPPPRRA